MAGKFRFKQFEMENERSAMKVNTDGVLLGALASLPMAGRDGMSVLDVGTGGGTVALMLSQRLSASGIGQFSVTGIDIDTPSVEEASANFAASPWSGHLIAVHADVRSYDGVYDMIVSNPPFYDSSLPNPDERRSAARHGFDEGADGEPFSYVTLLDFAAGHLADGGVISIILPAGQERQLVRVAASRGMALSRLVRIKTASDKPYKRIMAEFGFHVGAKLEETLTIHDDSGGYTDAYRSLMSPFYLWA